MALTKKKNNRTIRKENNTKESVPVEFFVVLFFVFFFAGTTRTAGIDAVAHHVDDHLPERLALLFAEIGEDVAVGVLQQLEGHGQVVVLQHRLVVVHQRQFRT